MTWRLCKFRNACGTTISNLKKERENMLKIYLILTTNNKYSFHCYSSILRQLTWLLRGGTLPQLSESITDAVEFFVSLIAVGDTQGALNFIFASREAKPFMAKEKLL